MADLLAVYQRAYTELLERLVRLEARGTPAEYEAGLARELGSVLGELDREARHFCEREIARRYTAGGESAVRRLIGIGAEDASLSFQLTGLHREAIRTLATNLYGDLRRAHATVGRRVHDAARTAGLQETTRKLATGLTVRQAQANLRAALADAGLTAVTDRSGRNWRLDSYAGMAIRTTSREATNLGRLNTQRDHGYGLVTITRHDPTCAICATYQGRVYRLKEGGDPGYPYLYATAFRPGYHTIHPNCGHSALVYVAELADDAASDHAASNRAFEDPRGERERQAYAEQHSRVRRSRERRLTREQRMRST